MRSTSSPPRVAFSGRLRRGKVIWTMVWFAGGHLLKSISRNQVGAPSSGRRGPGIERDSPRGVSGLMTVAAVTLSDRSPTSHDPSSDLRRHAVSTLTHQLAIRDIMPMCVSGRSRSLRTARWSGGSVGNKFNGFRPSTAKTEASYENSQTSRSSSARHPVRMA
jgi:hypothetical protein